MSEIRSFKLNFLFIYGLIPSCLFLFACPKKTETQQKAEIEVAVTPANAPQSASDLVTESLKKIAMHFRFAASLEREILKTIRPELSMPMTQFEILSTILDQRVGIKKSFGRIDCKLFKIEPQGSNFIFFKQCQTPQTRIADIETKTLNQISVRFYTSEWSNIVGQSVALTALDRVCVLNIENEKLKRMTCENTNLALDQMSGLQSDVRELRLKEFVFDQKAEFQVQVVGGFYKNLVEHRKLSLKIPFDGKIKIIEKELKVRDDFADLEKQNQITEVSDGQKSNEEKSENNQKNNQKSDQENNQQSNQQSKVENDQQNNEIKTEGPQNEKSR